MRTRINNITFTSGTRSINTGITGLTIDDIRLIVNESQNKVICSSMLKSNITNISSGVITYSNSLPVLASGDHITFEVDLGDNGAKLGTNPNTSLTSIDEKIDDFYDTFDADMALQLQGIIGEGEESVDGNSQTEGEIERLRTLQESYDELAGDSKQTIVDAINYMGGSATTNMTWAQLAYQIENNIYAFIDNAKFALLVPRPLNLIYLSASKLNGVEEIYDNSVISIPDDWMYGNLTIKKVTLSECTTAGRNTFRGCLQLNECSLEKLSACPQSLFDGCTSLYKVNIPNMIGLSPYVFYNNVQLIDIITGAYIASNISLGYNPAQAYRTDISTLCFDTDLEEYGQLFSTNWDKWKWCIINHFAANLQDRSGLTAYTITFGSTVLSHFDAEMIAAFTDKNWTLA